MSPEIEQIVWLSFCGDLKSGVRSSYRSDSAIFEDEYWSEIASTLSIEGLLFKPTMRDWYLLKRRPIIYELFANHITNLHIYGSSNPLVELDDESARIFCFNHAGKKFETSIIWEIDDPLTFSRILHDARNASFVNVSLKMLCSDNLFYLSDPKFAEVDEYGQSEVHQHEINIKRIDLDFE